MMGPLVRTPTARAVAFATATATDLVEGLAAAGHVETGAWMNRRFPDGESYCRVEQDVRGRDTVVVARLDRPDDKLFGLLLAADALRDAGAARVLLLAPYLPYLRQDERFHEGEAVSSRTLARLLRQAFDGLATIDPHLHRTPDLAHLFGDWPALTLPAHSVIAPYIAEQWPGAMIVGPDEEAEQWARPVAATLGVDWCTLDKVRRGDRDVAVTGDTADLRGRDVVLIDDIISTGRTLMAAAEHLRALGARVVGCVATHALFAGDAMHTVRQAGVAEVATTTAVRHDASVICTLPLLATGLEQLLETSTPCTTTSS